MLFFLVPSSFSARCRDRVELTGLRPSVLPHQYVRSLLVIEQAICLTQCRIADRIYAVFPLLCRKCGAEMRIIAFVTDAATVRDILAHLGEPIAPPQIAPARGPPLWEAVDAEHDSPPDPALQPAPAYQFDQRIAW